jgi:purine-binding chemotaxis protein CheW
MSNIKLNEKVHYVNFRLGNDHFAIPVMRVLEIIQNCTLTNVPNSSVYIRGVLNFRGEIVPVIDMYRRFNMKFNENTAKMIIIVDVESTNNHMHIGLLVDKVMDIIDFEYKDIQKAPDMGINYDLSFLDGFVDVNSQFIMVLNIDKVLDKSDLIDSKSGKIELINA